MRKRQDVLATVKAWFTANAEQPYVFRDHRLNLKHPACSIITFSVIRKEDGIS